MMTLCIMGVTCPRWSSQMLKILQLFVLFQAVAPQAEWVEKPRNQLVPVGGTARFVCKVTSANPSIAWTRSNEVLFLNDLPFSQNISPRFSLEDRFTLKIQQVEKQDDGTYGCSVQNVGTASANLTVLFPPGPPTITSSMVGDTYEENQTVQFTCSSTGGNPPPTMSWLRNGQELLSVGQTATVNGTTSNGLTVRMEHGDHQANYTCSVYNLVNQNSSLIAYKILNVRYSPIITFEPFSPYTVKERTMVNITCQVDANPPVTSVTWQKDGQIISGSGFTRFFSPVRAEDAANYTCTATNSVNVGNPARNDIQLNVVYPPVVSVKSEVSIPESRQLRETCSVTANPYPYQIVWEKVLPSGVRQRVSATQDLDLTPLRREDAGNYSCKASSLLRVSGVSLPETVYGEAFLTVNVQYAPGPAVISPVDNTDVGQQLTITCTATVSGYPPAQYQWYKNGALQSAQQGSNYVISSANLSDTATYSCVPYNVAGQGEPANVSVSVNEPPRITQGLQEQITRNISNTQSLTLTCKGQGRPEPQIEWFRENMTESLQSLSQFFSILSTTQSKNTYSYEVTSTLTFKGSGRSFAPSGERTMLSMDDLGNYTCRVRSLVHAFSPTSSMRLNVQFAPVVEQSSIKIAVTIADVAKLPCQVRSFPQPIFQWYRNGQPVDLNTLRFSEQQGARVGVVAGYQSVLTVERVGASDYGLYTCVVANFLGTANISTNLTYKSTPESPSAVQAAILTWESVYLRWTPGFDGGYPQKFRIRYQAPDVSNTVNIVPALGVSTVEYNITGLRPSTRYQVSVFGQNELGEGKPSLALTTRTADLELPSLADASLTYQAASRLLTLVSQPGGQYCLRIDVKLGDGLWRVYKQCMRLLGAGSLEVAQEGVLALNVSVCLVNRPEICGPPTSALVSLPESSPTLTVRDVIIIASVCALIIVTLLIILICFICRRRRALSKEYDNSGISPSSSNGGIPGKKLQQTPGQTQSYDNAGMVLNESPNFNNNLPLSSLQSPVSSAHVTSTNLHSSGRYPTLAPSNEQPPNYWDSNPHGYDVRKNVSFDSHLERQMFELEQNRRNDFAIYGQADGYRGQQESITMHGRPMSPTKDKYIDLEDRKDPSLQSQESGYSTGDPNKPKKVIYEVVV